MLKKIKEKIKKFDSILTSFYVAELLCMCLNSMLIKFILQVSFRFDSLWIIITNFVPLKSENNASLAISAMPKAFSFRDFALTLVGWFIKDIA